MDKKQYLQQLRENLDKQERLNEGKLENFRKAVTSADLKAALTEIPYLKEKEDVSAALDIVRDKNQDPSIRALALQKISNVLINDPGYIMLCLQVLQDAGNPTGLRVAAFSMIGSLSFSSRQFATARPDYMAILRKLVDDHDPQIRAMAAEELAKNKDEYIQRRLVEELTTHKQTIVPRAKAVQLLGYDIHADHFPIAKEILVSDDASEDEKLEAINILANDPSSKDFIIDLLTDKKQSKEIRLSSAAALQAADPKAFVNVAKNIVMDKREDKDLKTVTLNGIMRHVDADFMEHDPAFVKHVTDMKAHTLSPSLKKAAKRYVDYLKERNSKK